MAALVIAFVTAPLLLTLLRGRILDIPNPRSSHDRPTPRGGGVAIILAVVLALVLADLRSAAVSVVVVASVAYATIGFWDDLRDVPVLVRLILQLTIALITAVWLISDGTEVALGVAPMIALVTIWTAGYINAYNFMDGINGIAAAQLVVAGVAWALIGSMDSTTALQALGVITAGAALGFLPWNFPRARLFLGDVGSYFAGAWLSLLVVIGILWGVGAIAMLGPLLIFGLDTSYTIARRAIRGENIFEAHRSHIYQRLVRGGWSHAKTTLFYAGIAAVTSLGGALVSNGEMVPVGVGSALILLSAAVYLVSPRFLVEAAV